MRRRPVLLLTLLAAASAAVASDRRPDDGCALLHWETLRRIGLHPETGDVHLPDALVELDGRRVRVHGTM